jgi:hypothetical protein
MDNFLAGGLILPFGGGTCNCVVQRCLLPVGVENVPLQADHRSAIESITDRFPGGTTDRLQPAIVIGFLAESPSASTGFVTGLAGEQAGAQNH